MDSKLRPIGQSWLRDRLELSTPAPAVQSFVGASVRKTRVVGQTTTELYTARYTVDDTVEGHLRFALRYEPLDMGVVAGVMRAIDGDAIADWINRERTSQYARRAWFLYETFSGKTLRVTETRMAMGWTPALDDSLQVTAPARKSVRHRVLDNLVGDARLCVTVRKSDSLVAAMAKSNALRERALSIIAAHDRTVLARASSYLYTKETRSSFAIEHETPSPKRAERFMLALRDAERFEPDLASLVSLQQTIVEPRYAATGYRQEQSFVGETLGNFRQRVHFICPKPDDVTSLMDGFSALFARLSEPTVDPVVAAAVVAFAFVFIHPFEDGNGRIHRFLVHALLARHHFTPPGIIFPVSAIMERERRVYDEVLETFSKPLAEWIDWEIVADERLEVRNATAHLYRYFDATVMAEYLYACVAKTIDDDLAHELDYLERFDASMRAVRDIVDMPDKRLASFVRYLLQNNGKLSAGKRPQFPELSDAEVAAMELAVQAVSTHTPSGSPE